MGRTHHHRFFVPPAEIRDGLVRFSPAQTHQIARVLRLRPGDPVQVFDGTGRELSGELVTVAPMQTAARVKAMSRRPTQRVRISLAQVVPRGLHMDLIVAKATELGVGRIVLLESGHSVRRGTEGLARWWRIAVEAAEQSGRGEVPELVSLGALDGFLAGHPPNEPLILCHDGSGAAPLSELCTSFTGVSALSLLVGGEGGFSPDEVARCRAAGSCLAWLGPRRLRAETAALAALAVVQASLGDWRRPDEQQAAGS
ncbi:MAG: 16S rRNA (uracil(1498)-N(3))-methyltransferase [candidate division NC10 bacterium]|nr:16S rRNA (uracil(1498)-N(3))-methyltransferase [candidate division NC10 bacterium]